MKTKKNDETLTRTSVYREDRKNYLTDNFQLTRFTPTEEDEQAAAAAAAMHRD